GAVPRPLLPREQGRFTLGDNTGNNTGEGVHAVGTRPPAAVRKRWTRGEYEQLAKLGIFHPEERLELIEGEIFELTPQGSGHATAVVLTSEAIRERLEPDYIVRVQLPLALDDFSEPEPDIAVVPGAARDYRDFHPT